MPRSVYGIVAVLTLFLALKAAAAGEDREGRVFISPHAAHVRSLKGLGGTIGYGLTDRFALDASLTGFDEANAYWLGKLYSLIPAAGKFDFFVVAGVGLADLDDHAFGGGSEEKFDAACRLLLHDFVEQRLRHVLVLTIQRHPIRLAEVHDYRIRKPRQLAPRRYAIPLRRTPRARGLTGT